MHECRVFYIAISILDICPKRKIFTLQGKFKDAIAMYNRCIELFPENAAPFNNKALCHLRILKVTRPTVTLSTYISYLGIYLKIIDIYARTIKAFIGLNLENHNILKLVVQQYLYVIIATVT